MLILNNILITNNILNIYLFIKIKIIIFKKIGGRLRPDFLTVCQPDYALIEQQYNHYNLSSEISYGPRNLFNSSICTAPEKEVLKERTSFPSSHTYSKNFI